MNKKTHLNNAISPVIGVMLMLVITLVIVGVVGGYVNNFTSTPTEHQNNIVFDTALTNDGLIISFITKPTELELYDNYNIAISEPYNENEFVVLDYATIYENGYFYNLSRLANKNQNIISGWITESGDLLNGLPYTVKLINYDGTVTYGVSSGYSRINEAKSIKKAWFE